MPATGSDWSLVNRVVSADQIDRTVDELVESIARSSSYTVAVGKRAFYDQIDRAKHDANERSKLVMAENALADDGQKA